MSSDESFGQKYSNVQSSLQYFNFEGMDKDHIIQKYEEVLCQREKQIRDLAYQIGIINEKLCNDSEKIKSLEEENRVLQNKLIRKDNLLEQELMNKDIMFIKINNLQDENDRLRKILHASGEDITAAAATIQKNAKSESSLSSSSSFFNVLKNKFGMGIHEKGTDKQGLKEQPAQKEKDIQIKDVSKNHEDINSVERQQTKVEEHVTQQIRNDQQQSGNMNITTQNENDSNSKENNISNASSNDTILSSSSTTTAGQNNSMRISLKSAVEKRLASESIDYDPVFNFK